MYAYLCSWSHLWWHWVLIRSMYRNSCLICAHELIGTCGIYVTFEWHISFWQVLANDMFPVTWCWECHNHTIAFLLWDGCLEVLYNFYASAVTGAGFSVTCHWQYHWYHVMVMPMSSHDQRSHVGLHFNHLNLGIQSCNCWHNQYHLIPMPMLMASLD